jgi:hypothetical protein
MAFRLQPPYTVRSRPELDRHLVLSTDLSSPLIPRGGCSAGGSAGRCRDCAALPLQHRCTKTNKEPSTSQHDLGSVAMELTLQSRCSSPKAAASSSPSSVPLRPGQNNQSDALCRCDRTVFFWLQIVILASRHAPTTILVPAFPSLPSIPKRRLQAGDSVGKQRDDTHLSPASPSGTLVWLVAGKLRRDRVLEPSIRLLFGCG